MITAWWAGCIESAYVNGRPGTGRSGQAFLRKRSLSSRLSKSWLGEEGKESWRQRSAWDSLHTMLIIQMVLKLSYLILLPSLVIATRNFLKTIKKTLRWSWISGWAWWWLGMQGEKRKEKEGRKKKEKGKRKKGRKGESRGRNKGLSCKLMIAMFGPLGNSVKGRGGKCIEI